MEFATNEIISEMARRVLIMKTTKVRSIQSNPAESDQEPESLEIQTVIKYLLQSIDYFNNCLYSNENQFALNGVMIDEIKILDEFKDFVWPKAVRIDSSDVRTENLIKTEPLSDDGFYFSYDNYLNCILEFRSWFRKGITEGVTPLVNLKGSKTFYDVLPVSSIQGNVRAWDDPFIPIPLMDEVSCLFRKDYWNTEADTIVKDYLRSWLIK